MLEAKLRTNKDDVAIKREELDIVRPVVPFRAGEGVTLFLLVLFEVVIALRWSS